MSEPRKILVVANETVGGTALIEAVKRHSDAGDVSVHVVCPQNAPKHGYVIQDSTVTEAAENRLGLTLAQLRENGLEATGEVMDPDPYAAIMDAMGESHYDEIIVSTHPETHSGWLRQDLVSRVAKDAGVPVEHVVVDLESDREAGKRVLVVANQTVGGEALIKQLEEISEEEGAHKFVVICPANEGDKENASERLAHTLKRLEDEGLEVVGQVAHGDPYTAVQNALQFYPADEIVISTFPETRSGWLRSDLIQRVQATTSRPVHHVVVEDES